MASFNWNLRPKQPLVDSSLSMRCLLRGIPLKGRPEELLRQQMLRELDSLGFPRAWLAIEVPLRALYQSLYATQKGSMLSVLEIPNRRVDLVAYAQNPIQEAGGLIPFLLIECKAGAFTPRGWRQLLGYQHHVRAPFIAMVTPKACYFHALSSTETSEGEPTILSTLPSFASLLALRASSPA